jgi:hypothetical protein
LTANEKTNLQTSEQIDIAAVQTRLDATIIQAFQDPSSFAISKAEREVLRRLAGRWLMAARPLKTKSAIYGTGNNARSDAPGDLCDPENG